jgi:hypothetical protein
MHLTYNGVELKIERTAEFHVRRVTDRTGLDTLYREITVGMVCVLNPRALATTALRLDGDLMGVTLNRLVLGGFKQTLMEARKRLVLEVGPNQVFVAPADDAQGKPMPEDPSGGPHPEDCRVLDIMGEKSAILLYRIRFAVSEAETYVLSNRWAMSSYVGENQLAVRVVEGRAHLRLDWMNGPANDPRVVPDQFRKAFSHACPEGFIRKNVRVVANPTGDTLDYRFEDHQQWLNLGRVSPAIRIEGYATAGVDTPVKDLKGVVNTFAGNLWDALKGAATLNPSGIFDGMVGTLASAWRNLVPNQKANCIVRVFGSPEADKAELANLAIQVAVDRFAPLALGRTLFVASCYVTQGLNNEDGPFVEVRMEFIPASLRALQALLNPALAPAMMNLDSDVDNAGALGNWSMLQSPAHGNPEFPAGNQSRGWWLSMLVTQAITDDASLPPAPPADGQPPRKELDAQ